MTELWHDRERKLLVYKTEDPERVLRHVPDSTAVNGTLVALPATLRNVQLLRLLDLSIIPIMEQDGYDWPIAKGKKPLAHQKLMANFMVSHPHSCNLSDMGTMKTLATLWACDYLMRSNSDWRTLVVAPLSTLNNIWAREIFVNFLSERSYQVLHSNDRAKQLTKKVDFYIINYEGVGLGSTRSKRSLELAGFSKELAEREDIRIVVIDEASAYRDSRSKRHWVARQSLAKRPYLWLLTGTPTPNGPTDAFGIAKLVNGAKGESWTSFHSRTMFQVSQYKWIPRPGANEAARALLSPSIRFDIRDVWDGPEMTTQQREVPITPDQRQSLRQLKQELRILTCRGISIDVGHEAAARQKALQITLGAVYDAKHNAHRIDASPRLRVLREILEQAPQKILCFVPLTSIIDLLYEALKGEIGCERVYGNTTPRERADIFERFQQPESNLRLLIADAGTMAHGLNLVAATTVVWYGPVDRTELYLQANRRAWRPGQKYPVTIVQIVATPLEREIFRRLETNETLQGLLLDMVRKDTL